MSYLKIENMEIAFNTLKGKFVAVTDIKLEIEKGQIISIIGHLLCCDSLNHREPGWASFSGLAWASATGRKDACQKEPAALSPPRLPLTLLGRCDNLTTDIRLPIGEELAIWTRRQLPGSLLTLSQRRPDRYPPRHQH